MFTGILLTGTLFSFASLFFLGKKTGLFLSTFGFGWIIACLLVKHLA